MLIKSIQHGALNSEAIVQPPSGPELSSIITKIAARNHEAEEGREAYAIVKATNVILGVD